jgi:hypothetical protein
MAQKNILTSSGEQRVLDETEVDSIFTILIFSVRDFLSWWYLKMSLWHLKMLGRIIVIVDDNLSISLLIKNFFLPWRRDYSFIGYIFGILIKLIYLPISMFPLLLLTCLYICIIIGWLALPIATTFFIFNSILTF